MLDAGVHAEKRQHGGRLPGVPPTQPGGSIVAAFPQPVQPVQGQTGRGPGFPPTQPAGVAVAAVPQPDHPVQHGGLGVDGVPMHPAGVIVADGPQPCHAVQFGQALTGRVRGVDRSFRVPNILNADPDAEHNRILGVASLVHAAICVQVVWRSSASLSPPPRKRRALYSPVLTTRTDAVAGIDQWSGSAVGCRSTLSPWDR